MTGFRDTTSWKGKQPDLPGPAPNEIFPDFYGPAPDAGNEAPTPSELTLTDKSGRVELSGEMNAFQDIHDPHPSFP
jgi:hypothetical protein